MLTKTKFIICALNKTTGVLIPVTSGTPAIPVEYATQAEADTAAQTLANQNPSNKYVVHNAVKIAVAANVWE